MDTEVSDFQDWEVLHHSSDLGLLNSSSSMKTMDFEEEIEVNSEGMIRADYFSIDSQNKYAQTVDVSEEGSVESDNPSWIDPGSETPYPRKDSGEFWSDSGSNRSDDRKFGEFEGKNELGFVEDEKFQVGFEGVGEIVGDSVKSVKSSSDSGGIGLEFGNYEKNSELGIVKDVKLRDESEFSDEEHGVDGSREGIEKENLAIEEVKSGGEEEKKSVVWWKVPLDFLRYCIFRVSPVWTFSMAAAVMGFVILGRRLYKMKQKTRNLELKVTMDDKKVSQFMSRAARLNEAFSVVKRVPVIRPLLPGPAAGATPWPVMSLR